MQQRNLKQKFIALLKRFKITEDLQGLEHDEAGGMDATKLTGKLCTVSIKMSLNICLNIQIRKLLIPFLFDTSFQFFFKYENERSLSDYLSATLAVTVVTVVNVTSNISRWTRVICIVTCYEAFIRIACKGWSGKVRKGIYWIILCQSN